MNTYIIIGGPDAYRAKAVANTPEEACAALFDLYSSNDEFSVFVKDETVCRGVLGGHDYKVYDATTFDFSRYSFLFGNCFQIEVPDVIITLELEEGDKFEYDDDGELIERFGIADYVYESKLPVVGYYRPAE